MNFSQKDIKRAIRDFEKAIEALQNSGFKVYNTRVKELVNSITNNPVLKNIIGPYLEMEVDFARIENAPEGDWFDLQLPLDKDLQIAYVLQIMKRSADGEFNIENYALNIYVARNLNENIRLWNNEILFPCLDVLNDKLHDLIEDEVEGKEQVNAASLQIINYGSITAEKGNVAIGQGISQSISIGEISNEIIKKALDQGLITAEQTEKAKTVTDQIENELQQEEPSQGKLKQLASNLYSIGSKGLLSLTTNVITDPKWGEAVTAFLFTLI